MGLIKDEQLKELWRPIITCYIRSINKEKCELETTRVPAQLLSGSSLHLR